MKKPLVLALIAKLLLPTTLPESHPIVQRGLSASDDARAAVDWVDARLKSPMTEADKERWTKRLLIWSFYESSWFASPEGSNDQGRACGVMQVHVGELPSGILPPSFSCQSVRKDRVKGYVAGLLVLRFLTSQCGGDERLGMVAFATDGKCHPGWKIETVEKRIALE